MRAADWSDYELLDAPDGERLERWGEVILIRPNPQIIWKTLREHPTWKRAHAHHLRSNTGDGRWEEYRTVLDMWEIKYRELTFQLKTMDFKHTGIFPEQAVSWDPVGKKIRGANRPVEVLDLFSYTDAVTPACASASAEVCHANASRGMVAWARENTAVSGLSDKPVRRLVDDYVKLVQRERRWGSTYDGVIMDPPSYGRGPGDEAWKLEEQLYPLVQLYVSLLLKDALFSVLNSYTTGLSPSVMTYLLGTLSQTQLGDSVLADEIGLPVTQSGLVLPCGNTAIWAG